MICALVTVVQTCALPICCRGRSRHRMWRPCGLRHYRTTGTSSSRSCSSSLSSLAGGDRAEAHAVGVARNDDAIAAGHVHRAGMDGAALLADLVGGNIDIGGAAIELPRSDEDPSELQSLMRNSSAVFCL